ncbi:MAG: phosphatase [Desulfuromonadaceae bacterium]|nr:phosphatase [Desulfuromonadaceae bacterium]
MTDKPVATAAGVLMPEQCCAPTVDTHVHSIASGHAFSTVEEIVAAARKRGLEGVAITDHGPALPGGPHLYHFMALRFIPPFIDGVRVLRGVEANILAGGQLDLDEKALLQLDIVLAGLHDGCGYSGVNATEHTLAMLQVMEHPEVDVISHPGNPVYPVDYVTVVEQAVRTGTALEINSSSFSISRKNSAPNCLEIARLCAEKGALIAVGSDAHISSAVGEFTDAVAALIHAGVRPEQVVNRSLETLVAFLQRMGRRDLSTQV